MDSTGSTVLRVRTEFYAQSDPSYGHSVAKQQIGLNGPDFSRFVRLIDDETPHLEYTRMPAEVDERARIGGIFWNPVPPRFVQIPRQNRPSHGRLATEKPQLPPL